RLVGKQFRLEDLAQRRGARALRIEAPQPLTAAREVAHLGDEVERVLVEAQLMAVAGAREKTVQPSEAFRRKPPMQVFVEQAPRLREQPRGDACAGTKMHAALRPVAQVDLAERRPIAGGKGLLCAAAPFQRGESELDVLAGAELVRREVGTGAVVLAERG